MENNRNQNSSSRIFSRAESNNVQSISDLKLALHSLNTISECISITDVNEIILFVNKSFAATYGYDASELVGKHIEFVRSNKNDPEVTKQIHPSTVKEGWSGRLWNKRKDGSEFIISLYTTIVRDEAGNPIAFVGVARDLTEQIKAEEILKKTEDKYRTLFLELKDVVYESTPEGRFIELNPCGRELLGIKSNEDLEKFDIVSDFYVNKNDREKLKKILEEKGFLKDYELNIQKLNGEIVTVRETAIAVKNENNNVVAYRGILRDITEQKKNEAKLKQLIERLEFLNNQLKRSEDELKSINASKDKFFSLIAHDLRSPFTSLLSFSEFLIEDINDLTRDEIKNFAEKINEAARNVFTLLENLLQWARVQSGKIPVQPTSFDIFQKIDQVINLLAQNAENKKIKVVNETASKTIVYADDDMLFSVIQNLLSNAIKFSHERGTVIFHSNIYGNQVEVSISDNGVGIKEEDLAKLFRIDVSYSTYGTKDEKGSGLGLILCKEMIERNKGKIWVESKAGEGTTFTFTLPKA